jgi:putative ABC transport system permease protein
LGSAADVTNSAEQAATALQPLENIKTISLYSFIGALVAGAAIILMTMIMIVRERRREIGVIKAIGASNVKVMFQFMTEAVTLTVLAAVIGIVLGVAAGNPITKMLVNNSTSSTQTVGSFARQDGRPSFSAGGGNSTPTTTSFRPAGFAQRGALRGIGNSIANVHAVISWSILVYGLLAAIAIALVGSAMAAGFIAKIRPAEVMRVE